MTASRHLRASISAMHLSEADRKAEAVVEFQRALQFDPEHLKAIEALKVLGVSQTTR